MDEFLRLFKEIDSDKDGLIKYKELEDFYNKDYDSELRDIHKQKERVGV